MNIIFKGKDGTVAIMQLAPGADKNDAIEKFKLAHPESYIDHFETDEMPPSREFRDAWTIQNSKIVVDEHKAKQIHMGRIRHVRDQKLNELDKEQMKVLTDVNAVKAVEDKKQVLRDLPANWDSLEWPIEILGERK